MGRYVDIERGLTDDRYFEHVMRQRDAALCVLAEVCLDTTMGLMAQELLSLDSESRAARIAQLVANGVL